LVRLKQVGQGGGADKYRGLWNGLRNMAQSEGLRGMFKGNGTNCVRIVPNSAVKFLMYDTLSKEYIHQRRRFQPGRCSFPLTRPAVKTASLSGRRRRPPPPAVDAELAA
jgi:hypothetical protein